MLKNTLLKISVRARMNRFDISTHACCLQHLLHLKLQLLCIVDRNLGALEGILQKDVHCITFEWCILVITHGGLNSLAGHTGGTGNTKPHGLLRCRVVCCRVVSGVLCCFAICVALLGGVLSSAASCCL